jgi:hypothetical protein
LSNDSNDIDAEMLARHEMEAAIVSAKFPANTRPFSHAAISGWVYRFECGFGNTYVMCIYWSGGGYHVSVLSPEVEKVGQPHVRHLLTNAGLYLGTSPITDFITAYARSVLWATGYSSFRQCGVWPEPIEPAE